MGRAIVTDRYDCIVIGVGAMGSAACMHLALRGRRVLGLEQFSIPNAMGSSGGESRVFRLSYYEHADYVPLLVRAQELWLQLRRDSGREVFFQTGGLYLGREDDAFVGGSLAAARQHGLPHEMLTRAEVSKRFPMFELPRDFVGMFEPNAGAVMSEAAVTAHAEVAMRLGAELHGHEAVIEWRSIGDGVIVITDRGRYEAESLILTAGAWTGRVCAELGAPLQVARQVMGWVRPRDMSAFAPDRFPVWAYEHSAKMLHYGFPSLPGTPGVKFARHYPGEPTDVDAVDRQVNADDLASIERVVSEIMPIAVGPLIAAKVCLYTNSPDSHFIIDRHPAHENVFIACGFSGHGFKFASVVGEILADLATEAKTRHPIGFLSLKRFQ